MNKSKISLKDALKQGFAQVMGMPGVSYYRKGKDGVARYYNNSLDQVDLEGNLVEPAVVTTAVVGDAGGGSRSVGGLDVGAVVFTHGERQFTNDELLSIAFHNSGLTRAEWNGQSNEQIVARVENLIDDMTAEAKQADADAGGDKDPEPAADAAEKEAERLANEAKAAEQAKLAALRKAMDDAKAALDANDKSTPEGKAANKKLSTAYTKAKNAFEKAAGLSD